MTKIVRLDKRDIFDLVRIVLSEADEIDPTSGNQTTTNQPQNVNTVDTKSEAIKNLQQELATMASSEDLGVIVSLFIILLTDSTSVSMMRALGKMYGDHLKSGGQEIDFTREVSRLLKPFAKSFVNSVVNILKKESGKDWDKLDLSEADEKGGDPLQTQIDAFDKMNAALEERPDLLRDPQFVENYNMLKKTLRNKGVKVDEKDKEKPLESKKNKIKSFAVKRIKEMNNNPDVIRVFSMFIEYLTDKDTVNDLRQIGSQYGDKLEKLIDGNPPEWTENMLKELRSKFNPLVEKMAESIDKTKVKSTGYITPEKFKQDQAVLKDISNRYRL